MNPRAAINDLLPFQGSPFSLLGISPSSEHQLFFIEKQPHGLFSKSCNAEGGIRTHAPLRTNGFQDRLVMTTSIPLHIHLCSQETVFLSASEILSSYSQYVNTFFKKKLFFYFLCFPASSTTKYSSNFQIFRCCDFYVSIRAFYQLYFMCCHCFYNHCIIGNTFRLFCQ